MKVMVQVGMNEQRQEKQGRDIQLLKPIIDQAAKNPQNVMDTLKEYFFTNNKNLLTTMFSSKGEFHAQRRSNNADFE